MSVHEITTRLKHLSETNRALQPRIFSLAKLSTSETQASDFGNESKLRVELSTEIHQELKDLDEEFELIKQEAEDITTTGSWSSGARRANEDRDRERVTIAGQVERLGEDLKLTRGQFRKAQLQAKRNAEKAQRRERKQLFAGLQEGTARSPSRLRGHEKLTEDDILLNASSDVTAALRRTHHLMTSELQRSQFAHETLQRSTAALQSLNESYSNIDTLLSSSKSLVSSLVSSTKSDTWYLETAFWILIYTLVWLIFRRIFYGPIRYLAYLPTKWMLKLFLSFLQVIAGVFASSRNRDTSAVSTYIPQASSPPEAPLGKRRGRLNPALPRMHVPSGMGGRGARTGPQGQKLLEEGDKIRESSVKQEKKQDDETPGVENVDDPEVEAQGENEQWTADDEDDNEEQSTVLKEPEADETPNPKKRMWEEPIEDGEHDEL